MCWDETGRGNITRDFGDIRGTINERYLQFIGNKFVSQGEMNDILAKGVIFEEITKANT